MLCSVGADSGLHLGDGYVCTFYILLCQSLQCRIQALLVEAVVAVAGRAVLGGDGLADGAQVMLHVHLDELEDGLAGAGLSGVIRAGGHGWRTAGEGFAVLTVIGDTVDGTG